jgi:protein-disulfide isomerase
MVNARQARNAREKAAQMRAEAARKEARRRAGVIAAAIAAAMVIIVGSGILLLTAQHNKEAAAQEAVAPPANSVDGGMQIGSSNAKVTIEVWEDFQCPACAVFEAQYASQFNTWVSDGTAKIVYHPVAILNRYSSTEYSTRSLNAFAAVLNADPVAAEKYHELLFANQPPENTAGLPDEALLQFAEQVGISRDTIQAAVQTVQYRGWTEIVTDDFSKKGFTGTPTIVVNGKEISDWKGITAAVQQGAA